jgi:hypothetical protein
LFEQVFRVGVVFGLLAELKPVFCFIGFLGCYFQFMNKISFAFRVLSFPDIGPDRRTRFQQLLCKNKFFGILQHFAILNYLQRKFKT